MIEKIKLDSQWINPEFKEVITGKLRTDFIGILAESPVNKGLQKQLEFIKNTPEIEDCTQFELGFKMLKAGYSVEDILNADTPKTEAEYQDVIYNLFQVTVDVEKTAKPIKEDERRENLINNLTKKVSDNLEFWQAQDFEFLEFKVNFFRSKITKTIK